MMSSYWFGDVEDYKRFSGDTLREYKRYFSDYDYTQWDNDDFLEQKQLFGMTKWSSKRLRVYTIVAFSFVRTFAP